MSIKRAIGHSHKGTGTLCETNDYMERERRAWIKGNGNATLSHKCVYKLAFICENGLQKGIIRKET